MSGNRFFPRARPKSNIYSSKRSIKSAKQMERHLKGVANHRRIEILFLISKEEGISVEGITQSLGCNFKTISEHIRRLALAGLIEKNYKGRNVEHTLSPYGKTFISFLTTFSHS